VSTRTSALDAVVFGVDIQSGDVRGDAPSYALAVYDGEEITRDVVSHRKLRRLIDDEEPAIVATDNMYELAADKDQLIHFLGSLPTGTKLVQVTGAEQPEPSPASRTAITFPTERPDAGGRGRGPAGRPQRRPRSLRVHRHDRSEGRPRPLDRQRRLERGPLHPPHPRLGQETSPRGRVRTRGAQPRVRARRSGGLRRLRERDFHRPGPTQ